jgi:hypothetical protein
MARLDAVLGRSPLDRPEEPDPAESVPEVWLDQASAHGATAADRHKGADKGARVPRRAKRKPDPSVDRAETGEFGTANRIPGEASHASQPSSETPTKRRMRRKKQDP